MVVLGLTLLLIAADPDDGLAKQMLPVYVKEVSEYTMAVESAPKEALALKKEPIFEWSNPVRSGVQQGVVFLWLRDGRPAVLCSVFSEPEGRLKGRKVIHEFHALDPEKLIVSRPAGAMNEWKPEAGLARKELGDAPAPAATAAARLLQMRQLAQEFTGYETDNEGKRWDLRLLPAPLYRYPEAKSGVLDGALFTLVSEAGTDPEVLLLLEARETDGKLRWEYAFGRFSDRNLFVLRKDKDIWSLVRSDTNTFLHDPQHTYRTYADKVVSLDGKLLARVRATEKIWWGEFFPVNDK
jgi:hypothetical protein